MAKAKAKTKDALYSSFELGSLQRKCRYRRIKPTDKSEKSSLITALRQDDFTRWCSLLGVTTEFNKLPVELQTMIWAFTLPTGRRIMSVGYWWMFDQLVFPRCVNDDNPIALRICHQSRVVALKRYRLVFGTQYMYGDLEGGDILYFNPDVSGCQSIVLRHQRDFEITKFPISAQADLGKLEHLVIDAGHLIVRAEYDLTRDLGRESWRTVTRSLLTYFQPFKALKTVSINVAGSVSGNADGFKSSPTMFEDQSTFPNDKRDVSCTGWKRAFSRGTMIAEFWEEEIAKMELAPVFSPKIRLVEMLHERYIL